MVTWRRVAFGNCEADYHNRRARWEGPVTRLGGTLYCGECKRKAEKEAVQNPPKVV